MKPHLSDSDDHENKSAIVKAINELRIEKHYQTWKIISLLVVLMTILEFMPNIFG